MSDKKAVDNHNIKTLDKMLLRPTDGYFNKTEQKIFLNFSVRMR